MLIYSIDVSNFPRSKDRDALNMLHCEKCRLYIVSELVALDFEHYFDLLLTEGNDNEVLHIIDKRFPCLYTRQGIQVIASELCRECLRAGGLG